MNDNPVNIQLERNRSRDNTQRDIRRCLGTYCSAADAYLIFLCAVVSKFAYANARCQWRVGVSRLVFLWCFASYIFGVFCGSVIRHGKYNTAAVSSKVV